MNRIWHVMVWLGVAAGGCKAATTAPTSTPDSAEPSATSDAATRERSLMQEYLDVPADIAAVTVAVAPGLIEACGRGTGEYYFAFDSAKLDEASKTHLQSVADCLNTPGLSDDDVTLMGHASPPGTGAYNEALGMSRAQRVRDFLVGHGVDEERIAVQWAGEVPTKQVGPRCAVVQGQRSDVESQRNRDPILALH